MNKLSIDVKKIRNIGIIAHIDAGKTTTTERFLYYSGVIYKVGDVHHGNTTTDWMEQEKERGITIVSASIQLNWKEFCFNLIDTPGHLDFNFEVEKCLSILDGALVVIDGSAGVEPQTECVWGQAKKYNVSRIVFINKMDKSGASFSNSLISLKNRLSNSCVPVVHPYYEEGSFMGVYDLVNIKKLVWQDRSHEFQEFKYEELLDLDKSILDEQRLKMIENIAEYDDEILELFLSESSIDNEFLKNKIRHLTVSNIIYPVFAGSSFHNKCVQTILDGIIDYLPSPDQCISKCTLISNNEEKDIDINDKSLVVFVFKLVNDIYSGEICYARIYSGKLNHGDVLINSRTGRKVKIQGIIRFKVNNKINLDSAIAGDVVGLVIDEVLTGDTLCALERVVKIEKIDMPNSVVDFSIIPCTKNDQDKFGKFIGMYLKEDPTIKTRYDSEQKETIISGVGKLQIEILVDRLKTEKGIHVKLSKPKIGYRETITKSVTEEHLHKKQTGGAGQFAGLTINIMPSTKRFEFVDKITRGAIPRQFIGEIEKSFKETLQHGVINRSPVMNIRIELIDGRYHEVDSSTIAFSLAAKEVLITALKNAGPILLEPIFKMVVSTPAEYMNNVIGDIYSKEGNIINVVLDTSRSTDYRIITCDIPLRNIFDYADSLRSISKGMANFTYSFYEYRKCEDKIFDQK